MKIKTDAWEVDRVISMFLQSIVRENEKHENDLSKVYITDICSPCIRMSFYSRKYREVASLTDKMFLMWMGTKLHETNFSDMAEYSFEYEGIRGRVDEIVDDIVIEKKMVRKLPDTPYEHHLKQVGYYIVCLRELGLNIKRGILLYFDRAELRCKGFLVELENGEYEKLKKEMLERRDILLKAFEEDKPPKPERGWICKYCEFAKRCWEDGW